MSHLMTAVVATTLAGLISCDRCLDPKPCPQEPMSSVYGTVLGGGVPVSTRVKLLSLDPSLDLVCSARTDSAGNYTLVAPPGLYRLKAGGYDVAEGLVGFEPDTIRIGAEPLRADIRGGAAILRITLPEAYAQGRFYCMTFLHRDGEWDPLWDERESRWLADGVVFRFLLLPPGAYRMRLEMTDSPWSSTIWLPSAWDAAGADSVTLSPGETALYETALLPPGEIHGEVTGSWQRFGSDAPRVTAFDDDSVAVAETRASADGSYRLLLPLPAAARLKVKIGTLSQWIGGRGFAAATRVEPAAGDVVSGLSLVESGLLVTLRYPDHMQDEATLSIYTTAGDLVGKVYSTELSDGLPNLRPDSYFLHFRSTSLLQQPWVSQWYDGAETREEATPVVIDESGQVVEVEAVLRVGGVIRGRVRTADGQPCGLQLVSAQLTGDSTSVGQWGFTNGSDGSFEITALHSGDYKVAVTLDFPEDLQWFWYPGVFEMEQAAIIEIRDLGTVEGIEWRLPR